MVEQLNRATEQPERERAISKRAYVIWDENGQPEGKHLEHWLRAEQEHEDRNGSAVPPDRPSDRAQTTASRPARVGIGVRAAGSGGGEEAGSFPQAGEAPATRQPRRKA